ncbi:MAG: S8 family serine peptidase [Desulfobacteraceae bacterium]|nr:S8 family serine peptidase [Desulfobacteraceae bacterium]
MKKSTLVMLILIVPFTLFLCGSNWEYRDKNADIVTDVIENQYLVKFKTSALLGKSQARSFFSQKLKKIGFNDGIIHEFKLLKNVVQVQLNPDLLKIFKTSFEGQIEYMEPVHLIFVPVPGEIIGEVEEPARNLSLFKDLPPVSSKQWGLEDEDDVDVDILTGWAVTTGDAGVVVAVIDSGVDYEHYALANHIWVNSDEIADNNLDDDNNGFIDDTMGWDFYYSDNIPNDGTSHGTHVAGIIAANGNFTTGVAPGVTIMPLRFIGSTGTGSTADAARAIEYAIENGADIINCSWGGGSYSNTLKAALEQAEDAGLLVVTSAGNDGLNLNNTTAYPASYDFDNLISVASITQGGSKMDSSNYGSTVVHIAAPGNGIYSTKINDTWGYLSGTSMACPFVSGIAALIKSKTPQFSCVEIKNIMMDNAKYIFGVEGKVIADGIVNAGNALTSSSDCDIDADNDGTPDCYDQCPLDGNKTLPGECGCGGLEEDTDEDGTPDCNDLCPLDFDKTEPGVNGCGNAEPDEGDFNLDQLSIGSSANKEWYQYYYRCSVFIVAADQQKELINNVSYEFVD